MAGQWIALFIGVMGVAGVIFTALRYNRDDSTAIVQQQSTVLNDMHTINDELRLQVKDLREQIDRLRDELAKLANS